MSAYGDQTERFLAFEDVETLFDEFVRNANTVGAGPRTQRAHVPDLRRAGHEAAELPDPPSGQVLLLTQRKRPEDSTRRPEPGSVADVVALRPEGPGPDTQRIEAERVVPRVAEVGAPAPTAREKCEDGIMPPRQLEELFAEMTVLAKYGHEGDVRRELDRLSQRYPGDLLLLRRVSEFHLRRGDQERAMETLFQLAARLFERRNVLGMRSALEQVLELDPKNKRAYKLLGLLDARPRVG